MSQPQNKFLIGYGVVTALGAGLLGYLCLSANSEHEEIVNQLTSKEGQVKTLQTAAIFPKSENLEKKRKQVDDYAAEVDKLHTTMITYQRDLDMAITADAVNKKVGKYKAQLQALALGRKIGLPKPDFDLGLARYLNSAPKQAATPQVDYLVDSVNTLILGLFRNGITGLNAIQCPEQAYEKDDAPPAPAVDPKAKAKKPATTRAKATDKKGTAAPKVELPALEESKVLTRYKVNITFTGSEKAVQDSLNELASAPAGGPFFVMNSVRVENSSIKGPEKGVTFSAAPVAVDPSNPEQNKEKPAMVDHRYILGNEAVTVSLDLDLIRFNSPSVAQEEPAKK